MSEQYFTEISGLFQTFRLFLAIESYSFKRRQLSDVLCRLLLFSVVGRDDVVRKVRFVLTPIRPSNNYANSCFAAN